MGAEGGEESSSVPSNGEVASEFIVDSQATIVQRIWPAAQFPARLHCHHHILWMACPSVSSTASCVISVMVG